MHTSEASSICQISSLWNPVCSDAAILLVGALFTLDALLAAIAVDTSVIGLPERAAEIFLVLVVAAAALRVVLVALVLERNDALADAIAREAQSGGAVIGVLGMVHMNGVRRRLLESID